MTAHDQLDYVKSVWKQAKSLQGNGRVSKANRLIRRAYKMLELLKLDPEQRPALRSLLDDEDPVIVGWAQYALYDLFEADCLRLIRRTANEDPVSGLAARLWLKQHGYADRI